MWPQVRVTRQEYTCTGVPEELWFRRCWLRGVECWIMRPETHEADGQVTHRLELMSHVHLRDGLGLVDGDEVCVEVDLS